MSDQAKSDSIAIVGCGLATLRALILFPLWWAFLLGVLLSIPEVPRWVWVVFFIYVPVSLVLHVLSALVEAVVES